MAGRVGHGGKWTDERVALARELWAAGCSAGDIASRLGWVTRSAVLGKLHRLGLSDRSDAAKKTALRNIGRASSRQRKKLGKPFAPVRFKQPQSAAIFRAEPYVVQPHVHVPEAERKILDDLGDRDCRWPFGDGPDFTFCARPKAEGLPYCKDHARIAYQPPRPRRRAPPITINATAEEITTEMRVRV